MDDLGRIVEELEDKVNALTSENRVLVRAADILVEKGQRLKAERDEMFKLWKREKREVERLREELRIVKPERGVAVLDGLVGKVDGPDS